MDTRGIKDMTERIIKEERTIDALIQEAWISGSLDFVRTCELSEQIDEMLSLPMSSDQGLVAQSQVLRAMVLVRKDQRLEGLSLTKKAIDTFVKLSDWGGLARGYRVLSLIYGQMGRMEDCIRVGTEGIELIKHHDLRLTEEGGISLEFGFRNNIATIYSFLNRYEEALEHYLEARGMIDEGYPMPWTVIATNLGLTYVELGQAECGFQYLNQALRFAYSKNLGPSIKQMCHHAFGRVYKTLNHYEKAQKHYIKAITMAELSGRKYARLDTLVDLCRLQVQSGHGQQAFDLLCLADQLAEELQAHNLLWQVKELLATYYEQTGDLHQALFYYKAFISCKDRMSVSDAESLMTAYNTEYKVEKSYQEAELLRIKTDVLEKAHTQLMLLSTMGREITATLDVSQVVDKIYDQLRQLMDISVFAIGMYLKEENCLDYISIIEFDRHLVPFRMDLGDRSSYSGQCIQTKEPILLNRVAFDDVKVYVKTNPDDAIIQSIIFCPLILGDDIIGIITVQSHQEEAYSQNELEMVRILGSYIAIALHNSQKSEALQRAIEELEIMSTTDSLTGLYNRRYMLQQLEKEHLRFQRYHGCFSIVTGDIDYFKAINDTYGHDVGDLVLKAVALEIKNALRQMDYLSRWGGEEFLILMPESCMKEAWLTTERLRLLIENMKIPYQDKVIHLSITFGIVEFQDGMTLEEAIKASDRAMYQGKAMGRNCSVRYESKANPDADQ